MVHVRVVCCIYKILMCGKEWDSPITFISLFLPGQRIVVVRCEKINISGSFYRNKCKLMCGCGLSGVGVASNLECIE